MAPCNQITWAVTFLFLLQVVLGAILLDRWLPWALTSLTCLIFGVLMLANRPLALPDSLASHRLSLYVVGSGVCFGLIAVLLVIFVTRVTRNLRERDRYLADLRQRAVEEDHIVRIGLLATGAAHELGTPLASISVILSDWRRMLLLAADPELSQEIEEMQTEVARCKAIVTGILRSSGETRGEATEITTVRTFLRAVVTSWRAVRPAMAIDFEDRFGRDLAIVCDTALRQVVFNVLDNAAEASPSWIGMTAERRDNTLVIMVRDVGRGFTSATLENLGRPYNSSKGRDGGGLGLFLVVNMLRQLGGKVEARNLPGGGAIVTLILPLPALGAGMEEEVDINRG